MKCVTDLLGDLNDKPQLSYNEVMALQELGVEEGLAQRLRAYQVLERLLTDDSSQFEKRILNVLAGASYCEDTGGASGCFLKGQAL
ncbi:MAG: hypothetical protein Q7T93_09180, partial [Methylobacterium sp.]|uniref:hypothetical protein n=1 Tax=Methylobacterium sp. TaxID=409 RepID=UPI002718B807